MVVERADRARKPEQNGNHDGKPVENLDHRGRYEPLPLEQITEAEHSALLNLRRA